MRKTTNKIQSICSKIAVFCGFVSCYAGVASAKSGTSWIFLWLFWIFIALIFVGIERISVVIPRIIRYRKLKRQRKGKGDNEIKLHVDTIAETSTTNILSQNDIVQSDKFAIENTENMIFCKNCGKQIPKDSVFCLHCGNMLSPTPSKRNTIFRTIGNFVCMPFKFIFGLCKRFWKVLLFLAIAFCLFLACLVGYDYYTYTYHKKE